MQLDGASFALRAADALRDVMPQLMFVTDPDGATTYVNRPWLDYTGLPSETAVADGWLAAADPATASEARRRWDSAIALDGRDLYEERLRLRRASDGGLRWFLCRASPVREADGRISMYVGTCTDVDDEARESERQRTLSEASRILASSDPIGDRLRNVARASIPALGDWSSILLFDDDRRLVLRALAHRDPEHDAGLQQRVGTVSGIELDGDTPIARLLRGASDRLLVPTIGGDYVEANVPLPIRDEMLRLGFASTMAVPIVAGGTVLGALSFASSQSSINHAARDVETAEELARRTALSLENARVRAEADRRAERLRLLSEASRVLAESLDLRATLAAFLRLLVPDQADWAVIHLATPSGELVPIATHHRDAVHDAALASIVDVPGGSEWDAGASAAIASGRPYLEVHADEGARVTLRGRPGEPGRAVGTLVFRARASVPLRAHGKIYGALTVARIDARGYGTSDLALFEEIAQRGALAVANAGAYEREHRVATVLQQALLPTSLPADGDFAFRAFYRPGRSDAQVGGDWYDALRLYDGRIVVSIGDVSGSGLSAAVTMASMRQIIRGIAQVQADPALMLDAADKVLRSEAQRAEVRGGAEPADRFVTAFVGVLDPVTLDFTFASAGHPPPLLRLADGTIEALGRSSPPLGLRRPMEGGTQTKQLEDGSLIVFYTDGLTEATRDPIEGEARLRAALGDPAVYESDDVAAAVFARVLGSSAQDDVAIMTVAARGSLVTDKSQIDRFTMRFDLSDAEQAYLARRAFVDRLRGAGLPPDALDATELIVGELLGNVVRHAPGRAEIVFDRQQEAIVVHVIDRGHGFDVSPALPRDMFSEHGRGLFLISRLASDFQITRRPEDGSHARVVLATQSGPAGRPTGAAAEIEARLS